METNWLFTIFAIILFMMFLLITAWIWVEYGADQAKQVGEYMRYYEKIQKVLTYEVCEANHDWLIRLFARLDECKYKDFEMRSVLDNEFREKYSYIIAKRKVEDVI